MNGQEFLNTLKKDFSLLVTRVKRVLVTGVEKVHEEQSMQESDQKINKSVDTEVSKSTKRVYARKKEELVCKTTTSQQGLIPGFTRATFIVKQSHVDQLKELSIMRQVSLKEIVNEAFAQFLAHECKRFSTDVINK